MEIVGYRDVLDEIHRAHDLLRVSEDTILHMNKTMLDIANYPYGGQYKIEHNLIMSIEASGRRNVRFKPVQANETKDAMEHSDGNGRVSRLLSLLLLYKNEYDICKYVK